MPPISLLIKPASGHCNMRCSYCFYSDEISHRSIPLRGIMTLETQEIIIQKLFDVADGPCSICFQGGEPTLAGLPFFIRFVEQVTRYNLRHLPVHYSLQTNGLLIDRSWAAFFAENHFLIGLSLDGPKVFHDRFRKCADSTDSFSKVMQAGRLLDQYRVEFNVSAVVTAHSAANIVQIYRFFMQNGLVYQQYIPCLDPLFCDRGSFSYSLTPEQYAEYMVNLFDVWYQDRKKGVFVYIRDFENLAGMLLGYPPERCGMSGHCVNQLVIESNGDVYPCDFYTLDAYCIGNLIHDTFPTLGINCNRCGFIRESEQIPPECKNCDWFSLCRGGCRRDRQGLQLHDIEQNYYCAAFRIIYPKIIPRLIELCQSS
ncbi:MAG: anaerobic sulfatase maturase [Christensenella sp.]|nr:anaerobic sulfatase maturase [Christensenella sp.]